MKLLDLFCCAGGASMGYHQAGFTVTGVDLAPQPRYPFTFVQGDALEYLAEHGHRFDAIAASPPCQAYSNAQRLRRNDHPDLVGPTREMLRASGKPYVIENVPGAPLIDPVLLCGAMFPELRTYRHRLFETSFPILGMVHPPHHHPQVKMGRRPEPGQWVQAVGNFSGVDEAREALGVPWMVRDEIRECIPPAYTRWVGEQLAAYLLRRS